MTDKHGNAVNVGDKVRTVVGGTLYRIDDTYEDLSWCYGQQLRKDGTPNKRCTVPVRLYPYQIEKEQPAQEKCKWCNGHGEFAFEKQCRHCDGTGIIEKH